MALCFILQVVCTLVAALLHFFFLSSFCWVLTEAWQSYMAVTGRLRNRIIRKRFLCLGWGKEDEIFFIRNKFFLISSAFFYPVSSHLNVNFSIPSGLPALVVAVSVGFTKAKGYGTVN